MSTETSENDAALAPWEEEILDMFVGIFESFGLPKSTAMIYGLLYCSERPLLQEEISGRLAISAGSASQGLKMLVALSAVKRQSKRGQRHNFYSAERSIRRLLGTFIDTQLRPKLRLGRERLSRIADSVPKEDAHARQRVDTLIHWQQKADKALPLVSALFGK